MIWVGGMAVRPLKFTFDGFCIVLFSWTIRAMEPCMASQTNHRHEYRACHHRRRRRVWALAVAAASARCTASSSSCSSLCSPSCANFVRLSSMLFSSSPHADATSAPVQGNLPPMIRVWQALLAGSQPASAQPFTSGFEMHASSFFIAVQHAGRGANSLAGGYQEFSSNCVCSFA